MLIRERHNRKVSAFFLIALALHLPVFLWQTVSNNRPMAVTILLFTFLFAGPMILFITRTFEKILPSVIGFTSIAFSGLLIHLGGGMIELHFHIFVILAALSAFGLWSPVITAVLTAAVHHLGFFYFLPASVFNYQATLGIVLLHATFVILEAIPALYIAHQVKIMIEVQDTVMATLDGVSHKIAGSLRSMNESGTHLLSFSSETSSSIQSTSASVEKLANAVQLNTENAKNAAMLSEKSKQAAQHGDRQVQDLMLAIQKIMTASKKIEEITAVIDDLSFQTNLLALNAAVEAARAGDLGKGFAVVADAVRSLASRSSVAAKDISTLIQDSSQLVAQGVDYAKKSELALKEIVGSIDKVSELNSQISSASHEQSNGLNQITSAISKLETTAQSHTTTTSEITEMTGEIYKESEKMRELIFDMKSRIGFDQTFKKSS